MSTNPKTVCVIGKGQFGEYLNSSINSTTGSFNSICVETPKQLKKSNIVTSGVFILAVPIHALAEVAESFSTCFNEHSTIVDVCSVKEYSISTLSKLGLPGTIIHTHPLFGPNSAPTTNGHTVVVCSNTNDVFLQLFETQLQTKLVITTAEFHDREMAKTQLLNHLIGKAAYNSGITRSELSTLTHHKFMDMVDVVSKSSSQLVRDMINFNRFSHEYFENFKQNLDWLYEH